MLTHERNKNTRTKRGCLMCFQLGTTGKPFAYTEITFMPMYATDKTIKPVIKHVGICFKHSKEIFDTTIGEWKKSPYGKLPIKDELYVLRTEAKESRRPSTPSPRQPKELDRMAQMVRPDGTFMDGPTLVKADIVGDVEETPKYRSAAPGSQIWLRVPLWW